MPRAVPKWGAEAPTARAAWGSGTARCPLCLRPARDLAAWQVSELRQRDCVEGESFSSELKAVLSPVVGLPSLRGVSLRHGLAQIPHARPFAAPTRPLSDTFQN